MAAVVLLALLSTVPTLLVVAVGVAALDPTVTNDHRPVPDPFVTYPPAPAVAATTPDEPDAAPSSTASPSPGLMNCEDARMVGCGW